VYDYFRMADPMLKEVDFAELVERFDELLDAAERGETFRIFRNGRPVARMGPHHDEPFEQLGVAE
jgi:antitoxin (DNA-binding transcriptional repressor) of toxin-antitoxin stability system